MPARYQQILGYLLHPILTPGISHFVVQVACTGAIDGYFLSVVGLVNFDLIGSRVTIVAQHPVNVLSSAFSI